MMCFALREPDGEDCAIFSSAHRVSCVDNWRVLCGTVYVICDGPQRKDAPKGYGFHKTLYNGFIR